MEDYRQMSRFHIPGWLDSPDWAEWLQYCSGRGWLFMSKQPEHIFSDGYASSHKVKLIRACDFPKVAWLNNRKGYSGRGRPWPEDMPNN